MSDQKPEMGDHLSEKSSVFGLKIWVIAGVSVGASLVLVLFFITLWLASRRTKAHSPKKPQIPAISKEIQEIKIDPVVRKPELQTPNHRQPNQEPPAGNEKEALLQIPPEEESPVGVQIGRAKGHQHMISCPGFAGNGGGVEPAAAGPDVSHLGWGHWYTLRELYEATGGFSSDNVVGEGGYGIVYRGVLRDNKLVAVKNLLNNKGQAEREFKVEVEAIGRVRHKNLVRLLGYCAEGSHRMLVYEFMNNGNLEQWLHGDVGPCSPLTWEIRMNIILGTAKGLTYLHEGLEPKVVHRDIKSSNILLDKLWNSKVSDFGLAKLLCLEKSYVTTRVMGTFGYVAPEYASTGMLNESSDVYSFGILIMEIISGRNPVDYSRPPEEVNLVDWLKKMVSERNSEGVLDPKLPKKPCSRALKRALLVAFRCVDPNVQKRPKMGHIVHMLEADSLLHKDDKKGERGLRRTQSYNPKGILVDKSANNGVLMNRERGQIDQDFQGGNG